MIRDAVRLSVTDQAALGGPCELCNTRYGRPLGVVSVEHTRGGRARFAACARCTLAVRRLAAAMSGGAPDAVNVISVILRDQDLAPSQRTTIAATAASAELLLKAGYQLRDGHGRTYDIHVYGAPRPGGTWIGWIEFAAADSDAVLSTGRETTQSNREGVAYWASGLEPAYFQGAFARAR